MHVLEQTYLIHKSGLCLCIVNSQSCPVFYYLNCDIVFLLLNDQYTIPRAGFDPPSAEVQTSTEYEFDAFTLQATMAGRL